MQVTDVKVRKISTEGKMKAIVSVTFDNSLAIHDIKIIDGLNGLFVAMPNRKMPDGKFKDIAHPINANARENIEKAILKAYEEKLTEQDENGGIWPAVAFETES